MELPLALLGVPGSEESGVLRCGVDCEGPNRDSDGRGPKI